MSDSRRGGGRPAGGGGNGSPPAGQPPGSPAVAASQAGGSSSLEAMVAALQAELAAMKASNAEMRASNAEVTERVTALEAGKSAAEEAARTAAARASAAEGAARAAEEAKRTTASQLAAAEEAKATTAAQLTAAEEAKARDKQAAEQAKQAAAELVAAKAAEAAQEVKRADTSRIRELEALLEVAQLRALLAGGGVSALLAAAPASAPSAAEAQQGSTAPTAPAAQQAGVSPSLASGAPAASAPAPTAASPPASQPQQAGSGAQGPTDSRRSGVAADTWSDFKRLRELGASPTGQLSRNPVTGALTQLGPQSLGVRLAVLTEPPPPEGAQLSDAPHFARPAPPKGDDLYNKAGYKELRDAWNPQWKEADRLASLDDPKLLEQWLYRHAAHVGANGVTHGEQALMATITPEVQSQLHATPSFVAGLEGQPRGRPAAIFRWLLSHVRTINDREDVSVLPGLLYVKATHASGVEREITKVVVKNAEWAAFRSLERCKAFEARRARHLLSVFDEECIQDVTAKLQHEVGFAWTIERVVTEVRAHVELLRTARRRRRVYSRSASGRTTRSGSTPARSAPAACRRGSPRCSRNTWCCPQSPACRRRTSRRARRESATCRQRSRRRRGSTTSTAAARARRGTLTAACRPRRSSAGRISSSSSPASCATSSRLGRA